ncbi:MAG TPA: hypothetical protein PLY97_10335 [Acidocella sp.]|nr:hypothetical protein [Acidocella sp.]
MREVYFEDANIGAFLARLQPLWTQEAFTPLLVGQNDLAEEISARATQSGVALHRGDAPIESGKTPLIILTEENGQALHGVLMAYLSRAAVIVAPVTDWHFSKRPVFLISIPKAGTHLLYELAGVLGFNAGVEPPEFPRAQSWYCIEYENSHTTAPDFFVDTVRRAPFGNRHHSFMRSPAIFIYRHPLDILVSEAHYYHQDGKTTFAGWFDGLDFIGRVKRLLTDTNMLGSIRDRLRRFLPWLEFPNVIKVSFEELVGAAGGGSDAAQQELIWSLLLKLQIPGDPQEIGRKLFNREAATFRAGQIGGYRRELPLEIIENFMQENADILDELGYATGGGSELPTHRAKFISQALSYSGRDFDKQPIKLEAGFLDCNLVRYDGRIYALPISVGQFSLETLPLERLHLLPSAATLEDLKTLLLVGHDGLGQRLASLHKLATTLLGETAENGFLPFWQNAAGPCLVEEYQGFNILRHHGRFYGIRQSLGRVDLTIDLQNALSTYALDDFIVASSVEQIRDEIDQISSLHRLRRQLSAAQEKRDKQWREMRRDLMQAAKEIAGILARLAALEFYAAELKAGIEESIVAATQRSLEVEAQLNDHATANEHAARKLHTEVKELGRNLDAKIKSQFDKALEIMAEQRSRQEDLTSVVAEQRRRQEALADALRETIRNANADFEIALDTRIEGLQRQLDQQSGAIAAIRSGWPYWPARCIRWLWRLVS